MPKLLACNPAPIDSRLGLSKANLELVLTLERYGWRCNIVDPNEVARYCGCKSDSTLDKWYPKALKYYLQSNASNYDVMRFDHRYLPFSREEFSRAPLMVARSDLLYQHFKSIRLPEPGGLRGVARSILKVPLEQRKLRRQIDNAHKTIYNADLIEVLNGSDVKALEDCGIHSNKIIKVPNGISPARLKEFRDVCNKHPPSKPVVAFVGTFDYRKGCRDFPRFWEQILKNNPLARLKLLGTKALIKDEAGVRSFFPARMQGTIEVHTTFEPDRLPGLLSDCSIGVFPSYLEAFPFGVLEMMAAFLPVIAYDSPGAPEMVARSQLVCAGDYRSLAELILAGLGRSDLGKVRQEAHLTAAKFTWKRAAKLIDQAYRQGLDGRDKVTE